jgi:hypothetical protein
MKPWDQFVGACGVLLFAGLLFSAINTALHGGGNFGATADWASAAANVAVVIVTLQMARRGDRRILEDRNEREKLRAEADENEVASGWQAVHQAYDAIEAARRLVEDNFPTKEEFDASMAELRTIKTVIGIFLNREIDISLLTRLVKADETLRKAQQIVDATRMDAEQCRVAGMAFTPRPWHDKLEALAEEANEHIKVVLELHRG